MNHLRLVLLTLLLLPLGCPPADDDDATGDDDDATGDDDDATGDDDDATGDDDDDDSAGDDDDDSAGDDDDDSAGDDDDSAVNVEPCTNIPLPPSPEWAPVGGSVVFSGQGGGPSGPGEALVWFVPNDAVAADLFAQFGPITGGSGAGIQSASDLVALFDELYEDLFVVSYVQEASGECLVTGAVYTNTIIDAVVYGSHLHRDTYGPSMLPAFGVYTDVIVVPDIGYDGNPTFPLVQILWTERVVVAP